MTGPREIEISGRPVGDDHPCFIIAEIEVPVGFSDHALEVAATVTAVAQGAWILEKHFTLDRTTPGPDHPFALEPDDLLPLVTSVRVAKAADSRGAPFAGPSAAEREKRESYRRSVVASRDIAAQTPIGGDML